MGTISIYEKWRAIDAYEKWHAIDAYEKWHALLTEKYVMRLITLETFQTALAAYRHD